MNNQDEFEDCYCCHCVYCGFKITKEQYIERFGSIKNVDLEK